MNEPLTAIDLCSGAGGVTAGFKRAGVKVIAAVDTDATARNTYAANHPEVQLFGDDLFDLDPTRFMRQLALVPGQLGVLTACAPCQTFSSLSVKHRKDNDPRNKLVERVVDFAEVLLPDAVVMENVPQLAKEDRFRRVVARLSETGYGVWYGVVNAAEFGVPQRRRRLVLISVKGIPNGAIPQLSPHHPLLRDYAERRTVKQTFDEIYPLASGDPLHSARTNYPPLVAKRIAAIPPDGGSRSSLPPELQLACHSKLSEAGKKGAASVYGRMKWEDVAPTLTTRCTTPSCGRFLHPIENRAITLREAACLQTFPQTYTFCGGATAIQAQIGNAVPPKLAEAIAILVDDIVSRCQARRLLGMPTHGSL